MSVLDVAKRAANGAKTLGALGAVVSFKVSGRPIKEPDAPSTVKALGLTWYEQDEDGERWFLWWRLRDREQLNKRRGRTP
ncbi:MAG TPA: hypothetical protein VJT85_00035 [Gemmatimonadaceae bacterium]|nr:hypothetical protein [Gemmatimonadaceae bacterium]